MRTLARHFASALAFAAALPTAARPETKPPGPLDKWLAAPAADRKDDDPALRAPLTKDQAAAAVDRLAVEFGMKLRAERNAEMEAKAIELGDRTMRWESRTFGEAPKDGRSLWISMHGGGNAPARVNDSQWRNQIRLYEPAEGVYVAPRAPTDTWNLWHEAHIDPMFQRLVEDHVALAGVNPDKVYLLGYSAGGDGVWQLAPRMADRFAAAAMMAGHPNDAKLDGLRNLPLAIFVGGNDSAYDRNRIVAERGAALDELRAADPDGYEHLTRVYEGLPHWMNRRDAEALPWMAKFERRTWPRKVVWLQDDVTHRRFYWIRLPDSHPAKAGERIVASVDGQTIRLDGDVPAGTSLSLSDRLLDLDKPVAVIVNGTARPPAVVPRTGAAILASLRERFDIPAAATATLTLP